MSAQDWISEVNEKVKDSVEKRKPMMNEDGIKTEPQDPGFMYSMPWDRHLPGAPRVNTVSSFMLNDYHKEILKYLHEQTGLSDRKRITMIVEKGLEAYAKKLERGDSLI